MLIHLIQKCLNRITTFQDDEIEYESCVSETDDEVLSTELPKLPELPELPSLPIKKVIVVLFNYY